MKLHKLGLEWGAAYSVARPFTISTATGESCLVYEAEGGDVVIELPLAAKIEIGTSTMPDDKNKPCLTVTIPHL